MKGNFIVTPGQVIKILVGQKGTDDGFRAGGGGGTFVVKQDNSPLIIAGGGGGRGVYGSTTQGGLATTGGGSLGTSLGGTNGNGGAGGNFDAQGGCGDPGSGGGGLLTNGGGYSPGGGKAFVNGGAGGTDDSHSCTVSPGGGFGGGGAGGNGGGGGGGYSGGAGGDNPGSVYPGGGGGGSYNGGTSQTNLAGVNQGNGSVIITNLYAATITETKSITCTGDATGELTATVAGGTAPYTYTWSNGSNASVISNLTVGTYTVTVTDNAGNTTSATKEIKANDTAAPVITKTGTKVINVPAGQSANWSMYTYSFTDPLPAGAVVTGITLAYSGRDQGWGGTGAWARMVVSDTHIGSNQFFGTNQNFTIDYKGAIAKYGYNGNNFIRMDFDTWPGWVAYFNDGTMTIHYEMMPDVITECSATISRAPSAVDACAGTVIGTTTDPLTYTTQGTHVITWKFDDGNGNVTTATQNVIIKDTTPPTITAPATVTVNTDAGKNTASGVALGNPTTADNCELGTTTNNAPSTFPLGNTTVTWTATDKVGNTTTATQIVTVKDNQAPVPTIASLADVTEQCAATVTAPTATDNADGTITATTSDPLTYTSQGSYTIDWTYTDAAGNTTTQQQKVIVKDTVKPGEATFAAPASILSEVSEAAHYNLAYTLDVPDNANWDDQSQIAYAVNNAAALQGKPIKRIAYALQLDDKWVWVSMDAFSQNVSKLGIPTGSDVFQQTVSNMNIFASTNAGITTGTGIATGNIEIWSQCYGTQNTPVIPGASNDVYDFGDSRDSDNCYGSFQIHNYGAKQTLLAFNRWSENGGFPLDLGIGNQATDHPDWTFAGNAGAYTTKKLHVFVQTEDLLFAKDATVYLDGNGNASITSADVNAGVTDNCGIASVNVAPTAFTAVNLGKNTITLTATDVNGNVGTATAIVTVLDNLAPVAKAKNITVKLDATGAATVTAEQVNDNSSDNSGEFTLSLSKTAFTCENVGENPVTLTVTDKSGNASIATAVVTVVDKINPAAIAKNITVQLDATGNATILAAAVDNGSSDNCGSVTFDLSKTTFDCSNVGENTVTLTVTDASDNKATADVIVTVEDKVAPTVVAQNITAKLDATGKATIAVADIDNGSADACGIESITLSKTDFSCTDLGANTVTITVTDVNGNAATKDVTVTVVDETAPIVKSKNITVELDETGKATIVAADVDDASTDNCGIASIKLSKYNFDCSNAGNDVEVTLTVTDNSDNTHTVIAIVTVQDNLNPTITAPADVTVDVDAGKNTASNVVLGTPFTADNCSVAKIENDAPAEFPTGNTTVTWKVTDANGNTATATQIVTVRRDIVTVATPATIRVPIRTAYANVPLPAKVTVTYSDGATEEIGVTWAQGTYNGLVAGTYNLTGDVIPAAGTTNTVGKKATISVVVEPNKVPTALAFSATTFAPNIKADEAIGTLTTTDPDDNQFVYTLVAGNGDKDNSLFEIHGDKVYLKSNIGLSGKTVFSFRVRSTDPYQNTIEKEFTLTKGNYGVAADKLKIVNAFSPNGDGINDSWRIPELSFYNNVEVEVFDRSGVRLFHTTNPEMEWDGRSSNGQVLQGAFFYIVQVKDINLVKKGVVTILKK
ncbi:gliding motility-associated C-terminal domain-containing protein [Pontibacter sp. H259]|uniref:T9SS type B sorting domain-containing protein n=1 Tax=Pontibacter sp. H259 TaxID=3133421 RepID=UPI0030C5BEC4